MIFKSCWCGSSDFSNYAKFHINFFKISSPTVKIVKCNSCGTVRMFDNGLKEIPNYQNSYDYTKLSGRHYRTLDIISNYYNGNCALDVGCNTGMLLSEIRKSIPEIKDLKGIDLDKKATDIGRKRYNLDLDSQNIFDLTEKYDNIIYCHTIEHIPNLKEVLEQTDKLLNRNGRIFISVPNIDSLNARLLLRTWKALEPSLHLWYFNKESLSKSLKTFLNGYKIIYSSSYFIWPPFNISSQLWKYFKNKNPRLLKNLENKFLGDQLDIVIQKI